MGTSCCKNTSDDVVLNNGYTRFDNKKKNVLESTLPELRKSIEALNEDIVRLQTENNTLINENISFKNVITSLKIKIANLEEQQVK
jgi:peptidoglycan hydrolase CwlO-like protein